MILRRFLAFAFALAALGACGDNRGGNDQAPHDVLIKGGTVYLGDDSGGETRDIAIRSGFISFVGDADTSGVLADVVIDASGLIVAPGFIDPHTHALEDLQDEDKSLNSNYLTQGVTTVLTGNDGGGPANTGDVLAGFEGEGIGTNAGVFVGHGTLRKSIMGLADRPPTITELEEMKSAVRTAMDQGAIGLSTGLYYAPGSFADTDEIIALTSVLSETGGIYDSHIRDESTYSIGLMAAVQEVIDIGERTGVPVHIAHIKALGVDVWGQSAGVIKMITEAQDRNVLITADQYPWAASGTRISNALVPNWVKAGSPEAMVERLNDRSLDEKIDVEMAENLRKRGGPESILVTGTQKPLIGKTLIEVAAERGVSPVQAARQIVIDGDARIASFNMQASDIEAFMAEPWVMTSSDGTNGHPRKFASFPQKYQSYVKDRNVISLTDFIHRSSGLTADTFGLCGRGYLREGFAADIVVFDPEVFSARADFSSPREISNGPLYLFVNGDPAISDGVVSTQKYGQAVRRDECPSPKPHP